VRPVLIVVGFVLAQHPPQMGRHYVRGLSRQGRSRCRLDTVNGFGLQVSSMVPGYGDTFTVTGSEAIPLATTTSEYWPAGTLPGTVTVVFTGVVPVATPMVE